MNKLSLLSTGLAAMLALSLSAHAQDRADQRGAQPGVVGGPLSLIYVAPGVRDNGGGADTGIATSFHCTNTSTVAEDIRVVLRSVTGTVISTTNTTVDSARTWTASTHFTVLFNENTTLSPGTNVQQGVVFIFATSPFVFCSAMIVDAGVASPVGIALHMVRFNPQPGTQE